MRALLLALAFLLMAPGTAIGASAAPPTALPAGVRTSGNVSLLPVLPQVMYARVPARELLISAGTALTIAEQYLHFTVRQLDRRIGLVRAFTTFISTTKAPDVGYRGWDMVVRLRTVQGPPGQTVVYRRLLVIVNDRDRSFGTDPFDPAPTS